MFEIIDRSGNTFADRTPELANNIELFSVGERAHTCEVEHRSSAADIQAKRDRRFVELAELFLIELVKLAAPDSEAQDFLSKYFEPRQRLTSINGNDSVFRWTVNACQDWGMATSVIGGSIEGVESLGSVLFDFDPVKVNQMYPTTNNWPRLLDQIIRELHPRGQIRREPNSLWPRFCRSIISGAKLRPFETAAAFYKWVDASSKDVESKLALPDEVASTIDGFGFALGCMFLMEVGYSEFAKPDVHIIEIIQGLGLISMAMPGGSKDCKANPREVLKAVWRIAANARITPFKLDQMLWVIGSGKFWRDKIEIGGRRDEFIAYARRQMGAEG